MRRIYPLAGIGIEGVIEKAKAVASAIIAGVKVAELIDIELVWRFMIEYDCREEIKVPDDSYRATSMEYWAREG